MRNLSRFLMSVGLLLTVADCVYGQPPSFPPALSANSGSTRPLPGPSGTPSPDSRGWSDPALNHNRLLMERTGEGMYQQIGPYKVRGSSFLLGERRAGDLFAKGETGYNIYLSYNTYTQEIEFYSTSNPDKPLVKEKGEVDSFIFHPNKEVGIEERMKFVYGTLAGTSDKAYYQQLYTGSRFTLYKKFKCQLGTPSTNYVDTELREFDITTEYYYSDSAKKGLTKLKLNAGSIKKEFKSEEVNAVVDASAFNENPEAVLKKVFATLNK